jgi:hypothetical protein
MSKSCKYGEFKFAKSPKRPEVKGYAYGGATPAPAVDPMAAKKPMPTPAPKPAVTPAPAPKPAAQPTPKPIVGGMTNDQIKYAKATNQTINPNDYASMKTAADNAKIRQEATDARLKAEAKANAVPATSPYRHEQMLQEKARAKPFEKGGKAGLWDNIHAKQERIKNGSGEKMRKAGSKGAPSAQDFKNSAPKMKEGGSADMAQDKAMIKKAFKQHDQQEHKGGKGTTLHLRKGGKADTKGVKLVGMRREPDAVVTKEVSLLKKAGAPAKMIKEERKEVVSPLARMGAMKNGGSAKKGVPTFNRTPKC